MELFLPNGSPRKILIENIVLCRWQGLEIKYSGDLKNGLVRYSYDPNLSNRGINSLLRTWAKKWTKSPLFRYKVIKTKAWSTFGCHFVFTNNVHNDADTWWSNSRYCTSLLKMMLLTTLFFRRKYLSWFEIDLFKKWFPILRTVKGSDPS